MLLPCFSILRMRTNWRSLPLIPIGEADYNPSLLAQRVVCGARADLAAERAARNGTIIKTRTDNIFMNIQIFGTKKCNDTKKAERFFKERGIKYQFIDMREKGA